MAIQPESNIDRFRQLHSHTAEEHCPLCDQALPQDVSLDDLQERLRLKEQQAAKLREQQIRAELEEDTKAQVEAAKKQVAEEAAKREKVIRDETKADVEMSLKADMTKAKEAMATALAEKKEAEEQVVQIKAQQVELTNQAIHKALSEQREALDTEKNDAIQKAKAAEFEKNQKLEKQIDILKRQIEQKTVEELGEGAEIDLYEALREQFDCDKIKRIKKGQPGADILHEIVHNGQVCGSIVYDSKNHGAWRNSFIEKLKKDQLSAKADHAILTTSVFPSGSRQLQVQDDVIVLNPARAVELVRIIRQHIVQTHRLRLSASERDKKTETLYEFITSERCHQLMARYDTIANDLLELDVKEKKVHDTTWKKRGQLLKESQKVHSDYAMEIDHIVEDGTLE